MTLFIHCNKYEGLQGNNEQKSSERKKISVSSEEESGDGDDGDGDGEEQEEEPTSGADADDIDAKIEAARLKLQNRAKLRSQKQKGGKAKKASNKTNEKSPKRKKEMRTWGDTKKLTQEEIEALDKSNYSEPSKDVVEKTLNDQGKHYLPDHFGEKTDLDKEAEDDDTSDEEEDGKGWFSSSVTGFFKNITGQKPLTREDLEPSLKQMKSHLVGKNVAVDVAEEIIESVANKLIGEKLGSFTRGVNRAVREALEVALERVLMPKRSTDVLREIKATNEKGEPYSIVFIGQFSAYMLIQHKYLIVC